MGEKALMISMYQAGGEDNTKWDTDDSSGMENSLETNNSWDLRVIPNVNWVAVPNNPITFFFQQITTCK